MEVDVVGCEEDSETLGEKNRKLPECSDCEIVFRREDLFELHMRCHGSGGSFVCGLCNHEAADARGFAEHLLHTPHRII